MVKLILNTRENQEAQNSPVLGCFFYIFGILSYFIYVCFIYKPCQITIVEDEFVEVNRVISYDFLYI